MQTAIQTREYRLFVIECLEQMSISFSLVSPVNPLTGNVFKPSVVNQLRIIHNGEMSLGELMDEYEKRLTDENKINQQTCGLQAVIETLDKISELCDDFLHRPADTRRTRYEHLCTSIEDLNIYIVHMKTLIQHVYTEFSRENFDHVELLIYIAYEVSTDKFWNCFWMRGTCFMTDYAGFPFDKVRENHEKIQLLEFIEVPIQELISTSQKHRQSCRQSLELLLKDNKTWDRDIDKMMLLDSNESFQKAMEITGIEFIPKVKELSVDTRQRMQDIPYRRGPLQVYFPPIFSGSSST
jgi:hypothetical protein